MAKVMIIGSQSMDFVVETDIVPIEGETVIGKSFSLLFGGKGANQAIAAARLGNEVWMLGCVGNDNYGEMITDNFKANNVNTDLIGTKDTTTGSAHITVKDGDNRIIIVEGANALVSIEEVSKHETLIKEMDMIILQQEIPAATVRYVIDFCHRSKIKVLLNPAPARELDESYIEKLDYIIPNELEFEVTFPAMNVNEALSKYPNKLIITLGDKGALYHDGKNVVQVDAYKVKPVDTTGAGDCFVAAFSDGILQGKSIKDCINRANKASSLAISKLGAQSGLPTKEELDS